MSQELLSLSTLVERETIKIESALHPDGRLYELRNPDELGAIDYQTILSRQAQVERMQRKGVEKLTAADAGQMTERLNEIVAILVPTLEPEVLEKLSDGQKAAIVQTWADLVPTEGGEGGNAVAARTGGGSSRGSKRSTAAPRTGGSTSRSRS